ncbi:MAG: s-methyl-5-thioribose-1-phosphate isomerase [Treponema sp.]
MKNIEKREDEGMGYLLQYENVAWFEEGEGLLRILDRRIFPRKKKFVVCKTHQDVAKALKDMVTQSGGPFAACTMGMALAAFQYKNQNKDAYILSMQEAMKSIIEARPTTKDSMEALANSQYNLFYKLIEEGAMSKDIVSSLKQNAIQLNNIRYKINAKAGEHFANLVKDGMSILTHCFGETCFAGFLRAFKKDDKKIKVFCQETRPFLQGARLTASLANNLGFETTVITDGSSSSLMANGKIDYFVTATDVITQDGYVVNKVGTCNTAIVASYYSVPYYAIGFPSLKHKDTKDIKIEMRQGDEVLECASIRMTEQGVKGLYPAFDITPPQLIQGIATDKGIYNAKEIGNYLIGNVR